jgi:ubiquinone/menaquinone biosynthesis C-methylase UbiE
MLISEASDFLSSLIVSRVNSENWADLGCGDGFFTYVLAEKLKSGSAIQAVDINYHKLKSQTVDGVFIQFRQGNFAKEKLQLSNLDGILMANSLHYISDKESLLRNLIQCLKESGQFLIVEYNTKKPNKWVPYPIDYESLKLMFSKCGFAGSKIIGERKSAYGSNSMYAATFKKI